jgi:colicin import membrane protein
MASSDALRQDMLLPQPPGGHGIGVVLALATHGALVAALALATQWRTDTPAVVAAELWASVPEAAAPPPAPAPEPAPAPAPTPAPAPAPAAEPPPKVDIAVERERAKAEREKAERERAERVERERTERAEREKAERERREKQREAEAAAAREQARQEQLRRLAALTGPGSPDAAPTATGTGARDAAPSAAYSARLAALIRSQTVFSGEVPGNPAAEVEVRAAASGTILARRLVKSSGHPAWDEAVLRAIDRVGTLPRDTDGRVPSTLIVAFRPKE